MIKSIVNKIIHWLFLGKSKNLKKVVIVSKFDSIGDYILFRSIVKSLKSIPKFKGYKFVLLGNTLWKELYYEHDNFFDATVWIDRKKLSSKIYLLQILFKLNKYQAEYFVNFVTSLEFYPNYIKLLKWVNCSRKITPLLETQLPEKLSKVKNNNLEHFTDIINIDEKYKFELDIFDDFLAALGSEEKISNICNFEPIQITSKSAYIVSLGAGSPKRVWDKHNLVELILSIKGFAPDLNCILIGMESDKEVARYIKSQINFKVEDRVGEIALSELPVFLSSASFVICNESSVAHICASCGVEYYCISNLNHFMRFHPYPTRFHTKGTYFYPIPTYGVEDKLQLETSISSSYNINDVRVSDVMSELSNNRKNRLSN